MADTQSRLDIDEILQLKGKLLQKDWRMLIGGELVKAEQGETYETVNPANGEIIASVPFAQASDVNRAVETAKVAFESWRTVPPIERGRYIRRLAEEFTRRANEFAVLDAVDSGNPVTAMRGDVFAAAAMMEYMSGLATEMKGETFPSSQHWHLTRREPYGVIGRIIPYNHPIMFTAAKIAGPLIAGNTVVLKAPDQCPLSALLFGELCREILPPGTVNIVTGDGRTTGDALVRHPDVKRIALIGSVGTGQTILKSSAEVGIKHISLELGGKNAMIVFPDVDIDKAAASAVRGMNFTWCQGQSCGSTSRLFVHEDIYDEFIPKLQYYVEQIKIGDPLDPNTEMGCLVSQNQYNKVVSYIRSAHEDGARLLMGGSKAEGKTFENGYFISPTVFENLTKHMRIFNEEIFGPVLSVIKWNDVDDAIQQINSVPYGLTGSIWSKDVTTALRAAEKIESGFVWINGSSSHFLGVPYQGYKDSGIGSEEGLDEILSYTQVKTVNIMLDN
ncbi:aldehyde dehydrogenase family protein [Paenibacillus sp. EPM92]|uniref:aldehyde dehydrogenase family protein n=1 Tax=Paenibacillus sp. EPM92 TaxID=1561195 RepID=UPI001915CAF2|nr:aldehyde dehydrogenase family protein [Paenibacillus sp. EPM92]